MHIPRIMIAAPASGSGKTSVACALLQALKAQKKKVTACKCGPDYIDPMFHKEVLGIDSENLDLFFNQESVLKELFIRHSKESDITVCEGVMGYYDGMHFGTVKASTYEMSRVLEIPVILVLPCKGMTTTILAQLKGILEFQRDSNIKGILLNRISNSLYPAMKHMIEEGLSKLGHQVMVLGFLPEDVEFHLESRHLGLVTPGEIKDIREQLKRAAQIMEQTVDIKSLQEIAESAPDMELTHIAKRKNEDNKRVKIGIAYDEAFCFYYKDNLELLKALGCECIPFSPLHDSKLPDGIKGLILGGGYPELYAEQLTQNVEMRQEIKKAIDEDMPCLAECGGFMYLHEQIEDTKGRLHKMCGVILGDAYKKDKLERFGYVEIQAKKDAIYLKKDECIRGHEFHYWDSTSNGEDALAVKPDGKKTWKCMHMKGNLLAGYAHLNFYSNENLARRFVKQCEMRKTKE